MSRAVRRNRRSVVVDVLAAQRAMQRGTLSVADRAVVDELLPGFFDAQGNLVHNSVWVRPEVDRPQKAMACPTTEVARG